MSKVYFSLASGPFQQDWSNTALITQNDDWSGIASIEGFSGQGIVDTPGANAGAALTDSVLPNDLSVLANQTNPGFVSAGDVAEFELADPTIALQGSGINDAPHIVLYLDASGRNAITLSFDARDIDNSTDDAVQEIAVQYRVGDTGTWINLPPAGQPPDTPQIADATTGPDLATLVTPVTVTLPAAADNQAQLELRILTTDAVGRDEWVGIDNINVTSGSLLAPGDIAIVHYDSTGPDAFSFVFLRDVDAGTVINFTDNGWLAAGGFRPGEGTVTYRATAPVAAGAVVTLGGLDLDDVGDQIIAYQGDPTGLNVLYAIDFADGNNTVAGDATDANTTALPPGFALGTNAVAVAFNNAVYAGPRTGTPAELFADISDFHDWSGSDSALLGPHGPTLLGLETIALDLDADNSTDAGSDAAATFVTFGPGAPIGDADVLIADSGGSTISSATVTLAVDRMAGDLLSINGTLPTGITASSYDPGTGTLTLSGTASLAAYQAALHQVVYSTTVSSPSIADRVVNVVVSDGANVSNTAFAYVHLIVDAPPVNTVPGAQSVNEGAALPIAGVSVADADSGAITTTLSVAHGALTVTAGAGVSGNGTADLIITGSPAQINTTLSGLSYQGNVAFHGADTLAVSTSDGLLADTDTVAITVNGNAPTGIALSNSAVNEITPDGTVVGTLSATDPDPGEAFSYALLDDAGARFAIDGANLTVNHGLLLDFEQASTHTITVQVTDSGGLTFQQSFLIGIGNVDPEQITESATMSDAPGGSTIVGGPLDDLIALIDGNNVVDAGAGNDIVEGSPGNDRLTGGAGFDTAVFTAALGNTAPDDFGEWIDISGADGSDRLFGFEDLQFPDGTVHVNDGDPLFDTLYYDHRYLDVFHFPADARAHYENTGWLEGRDPNAFFSNDGYLSAYHVVLARDVGVPSAAGTGPLAPANFDLTNPLEHYRDIGWRENLDPSVNFDSSLYLLHNPDVAAAGVNPLAHFLANGRAEGRAAYPAIGPSIVGGFDAEYYLLAYPDIARAGADPLLHYETVGWREGRNPNAYFDTSGYLAAYPDVAAAGVNPLLHYEQSGWHEGRDPSGQFDTLHYLAAYPDVAAANVSPLDHFLQSGAYEGRLNFADGVFHH